MTVRRQWFALWAVAALYLAGFLLWPPCALSTSDENAYLTQAMLFAGGQKRLAVFQPLTGHFVWMLQSTYPIGTSLLQTPFVAALGWRFGALASALSLCGSLLLLARWLERQRLLPIFALLLVTYPAGLVLGRIGMSDLPSLLVCTAGLALFFATSPAAWFGSGVLAGTSLLFRETNVLVFAPLFLGCLIRRDPRTRYIIAGGILGSALRPISGVWMLGDPFHMLRTYALAVDWAPKNAAVYVASLLILVPGGLFAVATYRGPRRWEIQSTVVLFLVVYVFGRYGTWEGSWAKQIVLGPRYLLPVLPWVIYCLALRWSEWSRRTPSLEKLRGALFIAFAVSCAILAIAVHPAFNRWLRSQAEIVARIYAHSSAGATLLIEPGGVGKYVSPIYGDRSLVGLAQVAPSEVRTILARSPHGAWIVVVERGESAYWQKLNEQTRDYVRAVEAHCTLLEQDDFHAPDGSRLRVWKVEQCPYQTIPSGARTAN